MKIKRYTDPTFSVALSDVRNEDLINGCCRIPSPVTLIRKNAFTKCSDLEKVFIGTNVNYIGEKAFENCKKLNFLLLNENIESFAKNAFDGCEKLKFITVETSDGEVDIEKEKLGVFLAFRREQKENVKL